jgi:hypothetical protein
VGALYPNRFRNDVRIESGRLPLGWYMSTQSIERMSPNVGYLINVKSPYASHSIEPSVSIL